MKNLLKVKLPVAVAIVGLASYVVFLDVQANQESDERIGGSAVWNGSNKDLQEIREACKSSSPADYSQCFTDQMGELGASAEAIDFTQEYAQDHDGAIAILKDFRPMDVVDVGYAFFPNGKESRQSVLLLNGVPEILDLGDVKQLPMEKLMQDRQYAALRGVHSQIAIFPVKNIQPDAVPNMQKLKDGGQSFVMDYTLREGCDSCALLGRASFNFEFDAAGQYQGARLVKVEPSAPGLGK